MMWKNFSVYDTEMLEGMQRFNQMILDACNGALFLWGEFLQYINALFLLSMLNSNLVFVRTDKVALLAASKCFCKKLTGKCVSLAFFICRFC